MTNLPNANAIREAADRIAGWVKKTPVLSNLELDARTGGKIFLKAECLQETGSFKLRGATNKIMQLTDAERTAGVVAWSTGNHAQGVAAASHRLGISAKIVMPKDAPQAKLDGTKAYGAEVILYDRSTDNREEIGRRIAREENRTVIPPYDDPEIICGQGTAGLELAQHALEHGSYLDDVLVPASGGGLLAGTGIAVRDISPGTLLFSVEPEGFDDHRRSLSQKNRETNTQLTGSICDALLAPRPGALTWKINRASLQGGYAVSDDDVLKAISFAHKNLEVRLEPSGAITLAAVLNGTHNAKGRTVGLILSGGNVDEKMFNRALSH
ncbi:MAG: threonine/serine dehydratase [Rhodospirillaceae bacterium]|nr:threonine/serine dehydratase [Rhodospirillaceae bacterium]